MKEIFYETLKFAVLLEIPHKLFHPYIENYKYYRSIKCEFLDLWTRKRFLNDPWDVPSFE